MYHDMLVKVNQNGTNTHIIMFAKDRDDATDKIEKASEKRNKSIKIIWICDQPVHLQSFGLAPSVPGEKLQIGDTMMFNRGGTSEIKAILKETPAFITFQIEEAGQLYERKVGKTRFVPVTDETFERYLKSLNA